MKEIRSPFKSFLSASENVNTVSFFGMTIEIGPAPVDIPLQCSFQKNLTIEQEISQPIQPRKILFFLTVNPKNRSNHYSGKNHNIFQVFQRLKMPFLGKFLEQSPTKVKMRM